MSKEKDAPETCAKQTQEEEYSRAELNDEQKKAAFCEENAVVAAGAGSGKTMVLANRFAWLVTEKGYKIDQILTLTFTKKAASQMFRRIHSLLTSIANNDNGIKGKRAQAALDDFIHARIQTLDSYSAALVRQCASRYGISPDFEINNERSRDIATEEALPFLIKRRCHPAVERLYSDNRPNDIAHNIFSDFLNNYCTIDRQRDFIEDIKKQFDIICGEWQKQINEIISITNELDNYKNDFNTMCPYLVPVAEKYKDKKIIFVSHGDIRKYFDLLLNESLNTVIEKAEVHPLQTLLSDLLFYISDLSEVKLNRGSPQKNLVKENLKLIRGVFEKFSSFVVYCMQAGLTLSFMSLLTELQERFLRRKRAESVLTFGDIANLSRTILLEQKDIRQSEKETFKAIMIDEFQDNNELQKDLLFLLAENINLQNDGVPKAENLCPDKLFFVGDEKQSVYLFRDADVSVFRKLKDEIKSENLPLKINYRSVSSLIGAFNAIFGGSVFDPKGDKSLHERASVFTRPSQSSPLYEAAYTPLEAIATGEGSLSVCILNGKEEDENLGEDDTLLNPVESEAHFVAEKIEQLLKQNYQPKDIAILFRTHTAQYLFEKHLRLSGIPYISEDINDLFYSGVVNDIMSVLRLAAHHLDSASYAEMLRSPFAGLSLSGTAVCLSIIKTNSVNKPFDDSPIPYLDEEDAKKYRCGQKIYASICKKAESASISSLVSELWYNEGYRYETEWHPNTIVYREYFDYLYHLAVNADNANQGLAVFTEQIRSLRDSGERLKDIVIPIDRPGAVHLLTIHKSKGLEFPVVFICCCGKDTRGNRAKIIYNSNKTGIIFGPPAPSQFYNVPDIKKNFFWEQIKTEESRKNTAELRRLLYVAMTRAEEKLFLTGVLNISDDAQTDDFSLKIKNYTEKKYAEKEKKNEIYIEGDSIINNNTLFGMLLPAISSHIPAEGLKKGSSFFELEAITAYTEEYIKSKDIKEKSLKNNQEGLNEYINKVESFYEEAQIIETPVLRDNHITPVSLRKDEDCSLNMDGSETKLSSAALLTLKSPTHERGFTIDKEFSGDTSVDIFDKVDAMLSRFSQNDDESAAKFNSGGFGTIAHICVEALLNKEEASIPSNIACLLKPAELEIFLEAGKKIANRFLLSPLGKIAETAELRENEFSFRSILKNKDKKEVFINGVIDLIFDDKEYIHVVDFKTDSREIPSEHTAQMTCYYHAVSEIFAIPSKKQCRIWLYYLRTGHAIEMTEKAKLFNIERRAFGD